MRRPNPKRALQVWQRNMDVFRCHYTPTLIGNIGEPLLYLFGIGFGFGMLVDEVDGMPYIKFFAPGMMVISAMTAAAFECTFGTYTRMEEQRVFHSMLATPLSVEDIVLGEILWGGTKSLLSSIVMIFVLICIGLFDNWQMIPLILTCMFTLGATFAAIAIAASAIAWSYEFFNYFFTLFLTPMILFSGIYFPFSQLPSWMSSIMTLFPPPHAAIINRYLFYGVGNINQMVLEYSFMLFWMFAAGVVATMLIKRRLIPAVTANH